MPYRSTTELPAPIRAHLPAPAQLIYRRAFNNAWETYRDDPRREEICHRVAWAAVKRNFRKADHEWVARAT